MIRRSYRRIFVLSIFISSVLILNLFQTVAFSYAQSNGEPVKTPSFKFHEYSEVFNSNENNTSINLEFPELAWNITDIELNFTNIKLDREIKTIEDNDLRDTLPNRIYRQNNIQKRLGLAVRLEITEVTTLYGVFINGKKTNTTEIIQFQIRGYDVINNKPNDTIYRKIDLNMSYNPESRWFLQDFSFDPITLQIGNYSLVMIGNDTLSNSVSYYWSANDINPTTKNLYTSQYVNSWSTGTINTTYLYKLIQKTDKIYYPEDIEMTAELNGDEFNILNGPSLGTGLLKIQNISYFLNDYTIHIPIKNKLSVSLIFNYTFYMKSTKTFFSESSLNIEENQDIKWVISPIFSRISINYYIKFNLPNEWFNVSIYRKSGGLWENISFTESIYGGKRLFTIHNNTILEGAEWKINANSPNIVFNLNLPELEWQPGQDLQFSVNSPIGVFNLTFFLINPLGFGYDTPIEVKEIGSEDVPPFLFSYTLPSNSREGTYTIRVYWNNNTDAGVQSQEFQINIPPVPIDPIWIILSVLITVGVSIAVIFSYITIKKNRIKRMEEAHKLFNKCMDVLNLEYLIVSDKKSGLNMYQQNFSGKKIEAAMISGFLQAIHSFGIELIKIEDQSQTIKLEYKDSIILMTEFVNLRLILIMKESPSPNFLYSLEDLAYEIHNSYGNLIDNFNGNVKPFYSIEKLLKKYLNISLTYPLRLAKINMVNGTKFNVAERMLIGKAMSFMKSNRIDYFYLSSLLPEKACTPKDIENILNLIERNIFQLKEKIEVK